MEQEDLFIVFNVDLDELDTTFAYILLRANEFNYFNPNLSNGDLFNLYEGIMDEYSIIFDYQFDINETAHNMETFFTATEQLDEETCLFIDGVFGEYMETSMFLQSNNESATILLNNKEPGSIILKIGEGGFPSDEYDASSEVLEEEHHKDEFVQDINSEELFNMYHAILTIEKIHHPSRYQDYEIQLSGLTLEEKLAIQKQIILAIDIVLHSKNAKNKTNWLDIHTFLYNLDNKSNERLTDYLSTLHKSDIQGEHKEFEDSLTVNKMIVFMNKINTTNTSDKPVMFSLEEQWVFVFANQMKMLTLFESGEEN